MTDATTVADVADVPDTRLVPFAVCGPHESDTEAILVRCEDAPGVGTWTNDER